MGAGASMESVVEYLPPGTSWSSIQAIQALPVEVQGEIYTTGVLVKRTPDIPSARETDEEFMRKVSAVMQSVHSAVTAASVAAQRGPTGVSVYRGQWCEKLT